MGDAAQLYAPVVRDDDGAVDVVLGADHPVSYTHLTLPTILLV